jgi:hypothetical protein
MIELSTMGVRIEIKGVATKNEYSSGKISRPMVIQYFFRIWSRTELANKPFWTPENKGSYEFVPPWPEGSVRNKT